MAEIKKRKQFRKRRHSSASEEDSEKEENDSFTSVLEDAKELQRLRRRQEGVTPEGLALGKEYKKEAKVKRDPMKMDTGGYVDMKALKQRAMAGKTEEDDEQIGTTFAAETNRRDEDADMLKYVEEQLALKKGISKKEENEQTKAMSADSALYQLPDHLKPVSSRKKTEDMLSNQMLSGIPEVDLGIEAKIRNVEATEEAKQSLLDQSRNTTKKVSAFVPTNIAVNFVQHSRFNIEDNAPKTKPGAPAPKPIPLRVGDADQGDRGHPSKGRGGKVTDKSTDDFYFEKFRKQFRRF